MQPKKAVESRYAARDAADAKRAALGGAVDPADPKAAARAQQDAEARMMAEQLGVSGAPADTPAAALATANPTTKADFEAFAHDIFEALAKPHAGGKQYKGFVKALAKELCGVLEAESVKDVETALAGLRSEKLKAARAAAAQKKTGARLLLRPPEGGVALAAFDWGGSVVCLRAHRSTSRRVQAPRSTSKWRRMTSRRAWMTCATAVPAPTPMTTLTSCRPPSVTAPPRERVTAGREGRRRTCMCSCCMVPRLSYGTG